MRASHEFKQLAVLFDAFFFQLDGPVDQRLRYIIEQSEFSARQRQTLADELKQLVASPLPDSDLRTLWNEACYTFGIDDGETRQFFSGLRMYLLEGIR